MLLLLATYQMDGSTAYGWAPPEFNLSEPPKPAELWSIPSDSALIGNFARSTKWCPDGSVALVQCEHREFRILPSKSGADSPVPSSSAFGSATVAIVRTFPQPAPILDYVWYPTASPANPASFCFVASVRDTPVKLLDASDGRLRASYPIVDHRERQIAPHSLTFNLSATKLYCGFEDAIEVFDVGRPGEGTRLATSPSKKSRDGLKGIISALAFSPSYDSDLYAAGSLATTPGNIALFTETDGATPVNFVSGGPGAGVTQLHFNPMRPHILYAAFRRRRAIYSWDLRADVNTPVTVYSPTSNVVDPLLGETNQKRRFDVDITGRFLGVGDQEGSINIFDLSAAAGEGSSTDNLPIVTPRLTWRAHEDAIGGVSFHPIRSALLSNSGSRHFETHAEQDSSSGEDSDEASDANVGTGPRSIRRPATRPTPIPLDASMKLWEFGSLADGARLA
ncbi:WD40-repeat-containing domain protein [Mycena alexandri]|uniref:WD40-repeat-containing domain protein n=1 Tax=Mycena alexandri TaxID=1745969 RepID=A0AAD6XBR9_9AGAR|nr:WD40-repeat-containing domain protein [Mycena alexandri]